MTDQAPNVTQADRELYKFILDAPFATGSRIDNMPDDTPELQAIARHRASTGEDTVLREARDALDMALAAIDDHNQHRMFPRSARIEEFYKPVPVSSKIYSLSDARAALTRIDAALAAPPPTDARQQGTERQGQVNRRSTIGDCRAQSLHRAHEGKTAVLMIVIRHLRAGPAPRRPHKPIRKGAGLRQTSALPVERQPWEDSDILLLESLWPHHSGGQIAERMGRPRNSVVAKAKRLGLRKADEVAVAEAVERCAKIAENHKIGCVDCPAVFKEPDIAAAIRALSSLPGEGGASS